MSRALPAITVSLVVAVILFLLGGWGWVLAAANQLQVPVAQWLPWPVACSSRGCITTWTWERRHMAMKVFAELSDREQPSVAQSLTTLIRQHLAHNGQLTSPVNLAAAERYRTEILNATNEATIKEATGLKLTEYDELVIVPFLEQESLRQQRRAESPEDLYQQLAGERWLVVLPWHLTWDKQEGKVIEK